jgi:hypothetical protein
MAGEPEPEQTGADEPEEGLAAQVIGGVLYLVATPIGHRGDLSPRARAVLEAADVVAAEDTAIPGACWPRWGSTGGWRASTSITRRRRLRGWSPT